MRDNYSRQRYFFVYLTGAFLLTLLTAIPATAQTRAALTGSVANSAGAPVEFATLTLHRAADSSVVKTEFSDDQGHFKLEATSGANYRVSAAQVGFERFWSVPFELPAAGLALPAIALRASAATALKEVTVTARKPLFERQADRTVVNVEDSPLAAGSTTLDVLTRSPGVTVGSGDNLSLKGRPGVMVLIDGKRVAMSGTELADFLRNLPADQLKNIELITNPPAKYDAQGSAGIIAINLKKDQRQGTNGNLSTSIGRGQYNKFNTSLTLNNRRGKTNLFGTYGYADREAFNALTIHRDFLSDGQVVGSSDQENFILVRQLVHTWKAGLDYSLSPKTTVGLAVNGQAANSPQEGTNVAVAADASNRTTAQYRAINLRTVRTPNAALNLNFKHEFTDSLGRRELTMDADYVQFRNTRLQTLATTYDLPARSSNTLTGDQRGTLEIQSVKADYVHPFSKLTKLESGLKTSLVRSDNNVLFSITENNQTVIDRNQSNHFRYNENVNAGYFTLTHTTPKVTLTAGLRAEQTNATGRQEVGDEPFPPRHYYQLFPSVAVRRTLSPKHEVAFSLGRRIDRPTYGQLNPFRIYIDATTYGSGNPGLLPQTSYNLELSHTFRQKFTTELAWSITDRPIVGSVQPAPGNFVVVRDANLDRLDTYTFTFSAPLEPFKWWSSNNNLVGYYARYIGTLAGTALDKGRPTLNFTTNNSFILGHGWGADLTGTYQSRQQQGFFDIQPRGQLVAGISKSLWDKKGNLKLNVTDIFYTQQTRATTTFNNYRERFHQRFDTRVVTLAFNYRFGNQKVAPTRRRTSGAEDEKRRAG
ncbi:TonB-dependent receptor [Hymenobacter sp. BT683]|uniref:TonB-dependent receptor n=1 Tax=Hymenobacter jeongseonensis TaxID=2791027 RepID=A0ABS0IKV1_9BACT|nr:outer membrane beta-barrel family protein [Hymenobacter jeongseonensis]MBF9239002.1 TonB-dependent receptor [Hymenobacter jeongseonensis]